MRLFVTYALLVACARDFSSPPLEGVPRTTKPRDAKELAAAAVAGDTILDYTRPFRSQPRGRERTVALLQEACGAGDKYSCRIVAQMIDGPPRVVFRTVAANCSRGDLMSCRVLPVDDNEELFPDLPGATSRSPACKTAEGMCDRLSLRRECIQGFARACSVLATVNNADMESFDRRSYQLTVDGCRQGVLGECSEASTLDTSVEPFKRMCDALDWCDGLASYYKQHGQLDLSRAALERSCEYTGLGGTRACIKLASQYLDGTYVEPIVGRGQELLNFACANAGPREQTLELFPACEKAKEFQQ